MFYDAFSVLTSINFIEIDQLSKLQRKRDTLEEGKTAQDLNINSKSKL